MRGSRRGSLIVCVAILSYQRKGKNSDWTGVGMNEVAAVRTDAMLRLLHFLSGRCSVCNVVASASAYACLRMLDCCRICTHQCHREPIDTLTELRPYPMLRSPESKIMTQSQVGESKEKAQKLQAGAEALQREL